MMTGTMLAVATAIQISSSEQIPTWLKYVSCFLVGFLFPMITTALRFP